MPDGKEFQFELTYKDLSDVNHTVTGTLHVFNGVAQYVPAELISMKSATIKVTGSVSPFSVEDLLIRGDLVPSGFAFDVSNISYHGLYW